MNFLKLIFSYFFANQVYKAQTGESLADGCFKQILRTIVTIALFIVIIVQCIGRNEQKSDSTSPEETESLNVNYKPSPNEREVQPENIRKHNRSTQEQQLVSALQFLYQSGSIPKKYEYSRYFEDALSSLPYKSILNYQAKFADIYQAKDYSNYRQAFISQKVMDTAEKFRDLLDIEQTNGTFSEHEARILLTEFMEFSSIAYCGVWATIKDSQIPYIFKNYSLEDIAIYTPYQIQFISKRFLSDSRDEYYLVIPQIFNVPFTDQNITFYFPLLCFLYINPLLPEVYLNFDSVQSFTVRAPFFNSTWAFPYEKFQPILQKALKGVKDFDKPFLLDLSSLQIMIQSQGILLNNEKIQLKHINSNSDNLMVMDLYAFGDLSACFWEQHE